MSIEIINTSDKDKFLVINGSKKIIVGFIVKEIFLLHLENKSETEIHEYIYKKYNINQKELIFNIINNDVLPFLNENEEKGGLIKFNLFKPNVFFPQKILNLFFGQKFFYSIFILLIIFNFSIFFNLFGKINFDLNISSFSFLLIYLFFHEFGHSLAAKTFNLKSGSIGVGLYYFFPVLYVELFDIQRLKKEERIIVNLSGIYFQLFLGILTYILIVIFPNYNNILINIFCLNILVIITNLNPFLKFDGYWVISDFFCQNKLSEESNLLIKKFFKIKRSKSIFIYSILKLLFFLILFVYFLFNLFQQAQNTSNQFDILFIIKAIFLIYLIYKFYKFFKK